VLSLLLALLLVLATWLSWTISQKAVRILELAAAS
jgi:hypothetical protein